MFVTYHPCCLCSSGHVAEGSKDCVYLLEDYHKRRYAHGLCWDIRNAILAGFFGAKFRINNPRNLIQLPTISFILK